MQCGIRYTAVKDSQSEVQTFTECKHRLHAQCVKIRLGLSSRATAGEAIRSKCVVCGPNLPDDLALKLSKLDNSDKLDKLDNLDQILLSLNNVSANVNSLIQSNKVLSHNYQELNKCVTDLEKGNLGDSECILERVEKAAEVIVSSDLELRTLQLETCALKNQLMLSGFPETADPEDNKNRNGIIKAFRSVSY